jgi:glycosyltransferase involved in cell wall biosynthesis
VSRVLFLLPAVPEPPDAGAKMRNRGLIRLLGEQHEVDTLAFGPAAQRGAVQRAGDMALTPWPDMAMRLWSTAFADRVCRAVRERRYDAVQAEGLEMARYLRLAPPALRIYDAHNAEFLLQRRFAAAATSPVAAVYSRLQWRRLERFERSVVRASRMTLAVSRHDANQLSALGGPGMDVRVVPNGIDAAQYPFAEPSAAPNVLFLGKLDFRPNAEALRWFLADVFPSLDEVRLFAVGGGPPAWLIQTGQHDDRVAVTGYVADERPYLERCAALVLPLQTGGGSRLKALVAMASGLPVVSTGLGMEGLEAEPGVHYLRADGAAAWTATLRRLLSDAALRSRLAHAGRRLVEQRYDWSAIRADVQAAYAWLPT